MGDGGGDLHLVGTGSPFGVVPSRIGRCVCLCYLPLHHKVQKFFSGTGSPGWSRKKGRKTVVVVWWFIAVLTIIHKNFYCQIHYFYPRLSSVIAYFVLVKNFSAAPRVSVF